MTGQASSMAAAAQEGFRWRPRQVGTLLARTLQEWMGDKSPRQAAALAYYALFALGPLLLLAAARRDPGRIACSCCRSAKCLC
ncbi:MAG TPA: hypothetical protein VHI93_04385 [Candidatus Thermoplasmatota archaeon]|nr:hypothetical protein [Candidatus Thermoplasmatota archaeon]